MRKRPLQQLFYFSGHGYISESKVARIDEKASYLEHFPTLKGRTNAIGHMDHSDQNPIKERLMNELMRTDLDLAILHHHGYWDTQYLNGTIRPYTVRAAKEYIIGNIRKHIYEAKQREKNYDSLRVALQDKFDVPETWTANVLSDSLARLDSIADAAADLHLEDFGFYGYRPNVPMVIIDACFCGSFHRDNCIANEYIFQPGGTVANGQLSNAVEGVTVATYEPKVVCRLTVDYSSRNDLSFGVGFSENPDAAQPRQFYYSAAFDHQGGDYPMQGQYLDGTIELALDITEHLDAQRTPVDAKCYFLNVVRGFRGKKKGEGRLLAFSVIDYRGSSPVEYKCSSRLPATLNDGDNVFAASTAQAYRLSASPYRYTDTAGNATGETFLIRTAAGHHAKIKLSNIDTVNNKISIRYKVEE